MNFSQSTVTASRALRLAPSSPVWPIATANETAIIDAASACHEKSVAVAVFPELCLSGYAIEDLLLQDALLDATERALATVVEASTRFMSVLVVGAPLRQGGRIYNCAVVVHRGRVLGVVPKTYVPTYREFYEARHFGSGKDVAGRGIAIGTVRAPFAGGIADRLSLPLGQPSRGIVIGTGDLSELALGWCTLRSGRSNGPLQC